LGLVSKSFLSKVFLWGSLTIILLIFMRNGTDYQRFLAIFLVLVSLVLKYWNDINKSKKIK